MYSFLVSQTYITRTMIPIFKAYGQNREGVAGSETMEGYNYASLRIYKKGIKL